MAAHKASSKLTYFTCCCAVNPSKIIHLCDSIERNGILFLNLLGDRTTNSTRWWMVCPHQAINFCEDKSKLFWMFYFCLIHWVTLPCTYWEASIHAMIRYIRMQWCQWCIFDLWRTEISSRTKSSNISLHKSWKERKWFVTVEIMEQYSH